MVVDPQSVSSIERVLLENSEVVETLSNNKILVALYVGLSAFYFGAYALSFIYHTIKDRYND